MKEKFPYPGNPISVTTEMCDMNGHMNVADYARIFDNGSTKLYQDMGFTDKYFKEGFSSFTLEMNIQYLKELVQGDIAFPYYKIINTSPKLIHYGGVLLKEDGTISATNEQMLVHVNMAERKSSVMPTGMQENLKNMCKEHNQAGDIGFNLRLQIR